MNRGGFILGFGLLGAVDGIVFHQLLQWHSVYMDTRRYWQIFSDGLFHAFTVVTLVAGALMLWKAGRPNNIHKGWSLLWGNMLAGGGVFNLIEGIIDHHLLQIHHVKQGDPNEFLYDLAFLASGFILLLLGILIRRNAQGKEVIELHPKKEKVRAH